MADSLVTTVGASVSVVLVVLLCFVTGRPRKRANFSNDTLPFLGAVSCDSVLFSSSFC